jgi:hypothetical protein
VLCGYLDAVTATLTANGLSCRRIRVTSRERLHARLSLTPPPRARTGIRTITLCWAEETGWSITHTLLRSTPNPWRYRHGRLVPSPEAVAGFVTMLLTDPDHPCAMGYPDPSRTHQPRASVLAALTESTPASAAAGLADHRVGGSGLRGHPTGPRTRPSREELHDHQAATTTNSTTDQGCVDEFDQRVDRHRR